MTATIKTNADKNTLTIKIPGRAAITFSHESDPRVVECVDGKMFTSTEQAAVELAAEIRAMGVPEAAASGYAVTFWGCQGRTVKPVELVSARVVNAAPASAWGVLESAMVSGEISRKDARRIAKQMTPGSGFLPKPAWAKELCATPASAL